MLMKCLLFLTLVSAVTSFSLQDIDKEWYRFKVRYNRRYSTKEEEIYRYSIFIQNFKKIYFHNMEADLGKHTFWLGVNKFADMTSEEFQRMYANITIISRYKRRDDNQKYKVMNKEMKALPQHIDWRNKDNNSCVTRVKDQGDFRTCYAFAATAVLESHNCIEFGNLEELSEQNIIDCHFGGDEGLNPFTALEYILYYGVDTEVSYPYKGKIGECKATHGQLAAWVEDIEMIPPGNVSALKESVAEKGPVSVCLDIGVKNGSFHLYKSGVYYNGDCTEERRNLNHALLVVGYGETYEGEQYWILKNSWGTDWGEEGYMRLTRDDEINTCGIATYAMYPIETYYDVVTEEHSP